MNHRRVGVDWLKELERDRVDWLLGVPWLESTQDRVNVKDAAGILDADHYGLKDVKECIGRWILYH